MSLVVHSGLLSDKTLSASPLDLQKLRKRADFLRIQKSDKRWITPGFIVSCAINLPESDESPLSPPTIGFTITKKVGNAVIRNRIRRRFRHLTKQIIPDLNLPGWEIVLLARTEALTRDYETLGKDLRWAIRKLQEQQKTA